MTQAGPDYTGHEIGSPGDAAPPEPDGMAPTASTPPPAECAQGFDLVVIPDHRAHTTRRQSRTWTLTPSSRDRSDGRDNVIVAGSRPNSRAPGIVSATPRCRPRVAIAIADRPTAGRLAAGTPRTWGESGRPKDPNPGGYARSENV